MDAIAMREAARALPDDQLQNYTESFEAGIVGEFHDTRYCVACCIVNPASERSGCARESRYVQPLGRTVDEIESAYLRSHSAPAFRTALYDAFTEERAARAAARVDVPQPETAGAAR